MRLSQSGVPLQMLTAVRQDGRLRRELWQSPEPKVWGCECAAVAALNASDAPSRSVPVIETGSWLHLVFLASAHPIMLGASKYPSHNFFFLLK